jgi:hypothetical protein
MEVIPKPVYAIAFANGLIATMVLWSFWTPFIIFLARPLVNAQINTFVCEKLTDTFRTTNVKVKYNDFITRYVSSLVRNDVITKDQGDEIIGNTKLSSMNDNVAENVIDQSSQRNLDSNLMTIITMSVFYFVLMILCGVGIYSLCWFYNILASELISFNAVMAGIIIAIEIVFFSLVAVQYIPFDPELIIQQFNYKIESYLSSITQLPPPPPPCQFGPPLQDYYIGDWLGFKFGSLDEAQQRCLLNTQCVGVTTLGDGTYQLTWTRNKYVECDGCGYHNAGSTSWLLNACR